MKAILSLLFIASVGLNAAFLIGCKSIHDFCYGDPCKVSPSKMTQSIDDGGKDALDAIAQKLGLPYDGRDVETLKTDILGELNPISLPSPFDDTLFEIMVKDLDDTEAGYMREYHRHVKSIQGNRVFAVTPKD